MSANPKNMITNTFNKVKKGVSSGEGIFILIIVILLFVFTLIVLSQLKSYPGEKRKRNIKKAENSLKLSTMLGSIGANSKYPLRDYFVKSSFNSCAGGIGQKDWVDLKPLESVIKRGARMLDFQIVSKRESHTFVPVLIQYQMKKQLFVEHIIHYLSKRLCNLLHQMHLVE